MLATDPYLEQAALWPKSGRHILAHSDESTIVVYQAYKPEIGHFAATHGRFGGQFSFTRMSWVKPNFLWMMYRSGWGTKENQEVTLGLRVSRAFFDSLLTQSVPSSWSPEEFDGKEDWRAAVERSSVRVQWDPDHDPDGNTLARRAIQLGLRGEVLEQFGTRQLIEVIDMSAFVSQQRQNLSSQGLPALITPRERVYTPGEPSTREHLRLSPP